MVYSVHLEHSEEAEEDASEITEVIVIKTPLELVVTSTSPVKVTRELLALSEVNVVVYSVHPEHLEAEPKDDALVRTEVRVIKTPLEFVVISTSPVNVSTPPVESVVSNVVVYSVHPEHSEEDPEEDASERTEVRVTKLPFEFVVTSTMPVTVAVPPLGSAEV